MGKIKYKREYLVAINELLRSYEAEDHRTNLDCPLCEVYERHREEGAYQDCFSCPWKVLEKRSCMYVEDHYAGHSLSERIIRLKKWKEIYKR